MDTHDFSNLSNHRANWGKQSYNGQQNQSNTDATQTPDELVKPEAKKPLTAEEIFSALEANTHSVQNDLVLDRIKKSLQGMPSPEQFAELSEFVFEEFKVKKGFTTDDAESVAQLVVLQKFVGEPAIVV